MFLCDLFLCVLDIQHVVHLCIVQTGTLRGNVAVSITASLSWSYSFSHITNLKSEIKAN